MTTRRGARARILSVLPALVCLGAPCAAQTLPSQPIALADGRVTIGGDASASLAPDDEAHGYFNYMDYDHATTRLLQLDLTASARLDDHVSVLADIRTYNGDLPTPYGLYVRIRPWVHRNFDIQAGRVPPTFGAFARRPYPSDNILIGYPLAYQYLTSLRADALPATADELIRMRGRGWESTYSIGNTTPEHGVPVADAFHWDTGVQVHAGTGTIDLTGSVTNGTLSEPLVGDNNSGKNVAGRIEYHPFVGLVAGASASRGPFVTSAAAAAVPGAEASSLVQSAFGADLEYSRDYYLVRFETVVSDWTLPTTATLALGGPLRAIGSYVEGRYKLAPGFYVAGRLDHLSFSDITGSQGTTTWDAPVTRIEIGGGYSIQRNLVLKVTLQHDSRPAGLQHAATLPAAQLLFWF